MREWTVVITGDWYLPHFVNMLAQYRGNGEQTECRDEVIAQIEAQMDNDGNTTRPLVVIDADSRAQIERFRDETMRMLREHLGNRAVDDGAFTGCDLSNAMQAALREFAIPKPKPEEPTGLFAQVEDEDGVVWYRSAEQNSVWRKVFNTPRGRYVGCDSEPRGWSDIPAVRVLSEGWSE